MTDRKERKTFMSRIVTHDHITTFQRELELIGKSPATIEKYGRDIHKLTDYLQGRELTQPVLEAYIPWLREKGFKPSSIQSYLAVVSTFCEIMHWEGLKAPTVERDRHSHTGTEEYLTAEEYRRLVKAAMGKGKQRLAMLIQTISNTDFRMGELKYLTVEALRDGAVEVYRGENRIRISIPQGLLEALRDYMVYSNIWSGPIFLTSTGKVVDRSNVWREMKGLCRDVGIDERKVSFNSLKKRVHPQYYPMEYTYS